MNSLAKDAPQKARVIRVRFNYSNRPQSAGREKCELCGLPMLGINEHTPAFHFDNFCYCPPDTKAPAREWTIEYDDHYGHTMIEGVDMPNGTKIHVIEYSAFEEMRRERDELLQRLEIQRNVTMSRGAERDRAVAELDNVKVDRDAYKAAWNMTEQKLKELRTLACELAGVLGMIDHVGLAKPYDKIVRDALSAARAAGCVE